MQLTSELEKPTVPYQSIDVPNALRVVRPSLGDNAGVALDRVRHLLGTKDRRTRALPLRRRFDRSFAYDELQAKDPCCRNEVHLRSRR